MGLTIEKSKKQPNILIGLEYEGIIRDNEGKIVVYNDMPISARKNIINNYCAKPSSDKHPTDRYNCLAEIKTEPQRLILHESHCVVESLLSEIYDMEMLFRNNGYGITWGEDTIPDETHLKIIRQMDKSIDIKEDTLGKKITYTLDKSDKPIQFKSKDNRRRGGGLHITLSGIEDYVNVEFIKAVDTYKDKNIFSYCFNSVYRNNLLFREKRVDDTYLFEYMSFGLNLECEGYRKYQYLRYFEMFLDNICSYISGVTQ